MHDLSKQTTLPSVHKPDAALGIELHSRRRPRMAAIQTFKGHLAYPDSRSTPEGSGRSGGFLGILVEKQFEGQVRQLMYGAWSQRTGFGKITLVVDDDIDVWDDFAVDWALSWHVRPEKDVYIERDVQAVGLDPSQAPADVLQHHPSRYVGSRIAIDATRKHKYPAISLPPKEHLDLVAS